MAQLTVLSILFFLYSSVFASAHIAQRSASVTTTTKTSTTTTSATPVVNLLTNGDFETGTDSSWYIANIDPSWGGPTYNVGTATSDDTIGDPGNWMLELRAHINQTGSGAILAQGFDTIVGENYTINLDLAVKGTGFLDLNIDTTASIYDFFATFSQPTSGWQHVTYSFVATQTRHHFYIWFDGAGGYGLWDFDNIVIQQVPTIAPKTTSSASKSSTKATSSTSTSTTAPTATPTYGPNFLTNGNFETGSTSSWYVSESWNSYHIGTAVSNDTISPGGKWMLELQTPYHSDINVYGAVLTQSFNTVVGKNYTVELDILFLESGSIWVGHSDPSGPPNNWALIIQAFNGWKHFSYQFEAELTKYHFNIEFETLYAGSGWWDCDNIGIYEVIS